MPIGRIVTTAALVTAAFAACGAWGCDDRSAAPATAPATAGRTAAVERRVEVRSVAPLLPGRQTHVAVSPAGGEVYWLQEGGATAAPDVVFALGADGVPRATALSARGVIAAMGADPGKASGAIQSLAAGADGAVYFTFAGGQGARTLACVGRYDRAAARIEVLADTPRLASATGMGLSLALARLTVVASPDGAHLWLWVRHSDQFALFRLTTAAADEARGVELARPFERVTTEHGEAVSLTRESQSLAVAPDGAPVLLDVPAAALRRIDPATGAAQDLLPLVGLPDALSAPASVDEGRVLLFAAAGADPILPRTPDQIARRTFLPSGKGPPALIVVDGAAVERVVPAAEFDVRGGQVPLHSLRLQQLVGNGDGTYVGYDATSGELLRLRVADSSRDH